MLWRRETKHAEACPLSLQTFATTPPGVTRRIVDGDTSDLHVGDRRNALRRKAVIKNCVVAWDDPGKGNALIEDSRAPLAWERVAPRVMVT